MICYCPGHNFVITQLLLLVSARNQDLRTWMIKRDQQTVIPFTNPGSVILQAEVMIMNGLQGLKSHGPQRDENTGRYEFDCAFETDRPVSDIARARAPIRARRRAGMT